MDDLQITKKGEAYAAASLAADPETLLVPLTNRKAIADSIERLIDMLDAMSPDPDLEDGADDEPSLGWGLRGGQSFLAGTAPNLPPTDTCDLELDTSDDEPNGDERDASCPANWAKGGHWCEDVEEENEHGGDILDEPHDGESDSEPWLGWGNVTGQPGVDISSLAGLEDSPDYGGAGNFTGEGCIRAREMLRGRGRNECSLTIVGPAFPLSDFRR
jgi:hypothetical protein